MRASIVIPSHNEGSRLWKTVESCYESTVGLDYEVIVADDASSDGSVEEAQRRYPQVRLVAHHRRLGVSPTKDLGARSAQGDVLIFVDGHCKPEAGAIRQLVEDIELCDGQAILTPRIPHLDWVTWENKKFLVGCGFRMELRDFQCAWVETNELEARGDFYEMPALIGCCNAMSRDLYEELHGFDGHMLEWGLEDIDFGLRAWLTGHSILHDPRAAIGHRFAHSFDNFSVSDERVLANKLRMARKTFSDDVWSEWIQEQRSRTPQELWETAWTLYCRDSESVERERDYLMARRVRDEFDYAEQFGLEWPRRPPRASEAGG